ncbi:Endonuclease NS domain containing protein [Asbolus verrucosus]|uniref:Endonuclease NS domain containing protein n=1 Tax=Asbolus verrucosus TaxID=1661398 RepID=A0A482VUF8_ASBVE|nr:Endonuclease NS domain containing protein [Asbolus verrucosus]
MFRSWDPVVLSSSTYELIYPPVENAPNDRNITLPVSETIIISCNGGHFDDITTKTLLATCNQDGQFEVQDAIIEFDKLSCVNFQPQVAKVSDTPCGPNAVLIEIGFQIGLNIKLVPQIVVCFDVKNLNPLYTNHNLTKSIGFIKSYLTTPYVVDPIYNVSIDFDELYSVDYQLSTINRLLGLPANSTRYVDPASCNPDPIITTPGFCFSRRPLTYRGDFVYISQQDATYRYITVAAQWSFVDYNLEDLQNNVIDYVKKNKLDLEVYTGSYGIVTLPHADTGEDVELYLYVSGDVKAIPVPLLFWKLIYDPLTQRATVFVSVNNPHQTDVSKNIICEDISDGITWLTWEKHNVTKGYSYACAYEDAKATITYLPEIEVKGTLGTVRDKYHPPAV